MADLWDRLGQSAAAPKPKRRRVKVPSRPSTAPGAGAPPPRIRIQRPPKGAATRPPSFPKADRPLPARGSSPKPAARVDPEFAAFSARVEAGKAAMTRGRSPEGESPKVAGFSAENIAEFRRRGLGTGGGSNLIANLGRDAIDVITGIPSAAQLGAKGLAYPAVRALEATGGLEPGVSEGIEEDFKTAGRAIKDDYSTRYGGLVRAYTDIASGRDPRENLSDFADQAYQHPGLLALDVASVGSGVGAGIRGGARLGARIAPRGSSTATRLARIGSKAITPGSVRYRPPRVRTVEMGENTALGADGASVARVVTPRRPYSANPISRGIQKSMERPRAAIARRVERAADNDSALAKPFSRQAKFNRDVARNARDFRMNADFARDKAVRVETRDYVQAVRELDRAGISDLARRGSSKWSREEVDAALYLHSRDLLRVEGKTPKQAQQAVVQFMREGLDEAVLSGGVRSKGAQATIDAIAKVPDELLDLKTAPPQFQRALAEYKKISTLATEGRIAAGAIKSTTADEVRTRPARAVFEGARYDPKSGAWTSPRNPYSPVGSRAVYTQDIPRDPLKRGRAGDPSGAFGRMTQDKVKQSHGTLFRQGNVSIDRGLPVKALERAIIDRSHPKFVKDFYDTFSFKRPDGQKAKGQRARMAMEADPDNVVLMSEKSLNDAVRLGQDLPDGQFPDDLLRGVDVFEGGDGLARARTLGDNNDLIAFPKAAVDGMRQGWENLAGGRIGVFDTPQGYWKRGILAFAPRWYVNSLAGNTFQYGMLTGGDLKSLFQARRSRMGEAVPERITGSTNVAEARISDPRFGPATKMGRGITKASDVGMNFQHKLDSVFRRAAYINQVKKGLKAEGVNLRKLSGDDLMRAIENAPKEVMDQAIRETELFLGDYLRMSPVERATLRRVFPFYSWMKVIGKFMFLVPIKHPKRTLVTSMIARASAEAINPDDFMKPTLANRGLINGPANLSMRSAGMNPLFTHADLVKSVAGRDLGSTAGTLAGNLSPIGLQQAARIYSGTAGMGIPVTYPAGYEGSASQFGRSTMRIDPVTGLPEYFEPSVPLQEQLLQTIPLLPQIARGVASGDRRPYDVTTTPDLLLRSKPDDELFQEDRDRAMEPIPYLGPFLGWAGINVQRRDRAQEKKDYEKRLKDWEAAERQTKKRKRKAKRTR